ISTELGLMLQFCLMENSCLNSKEVKELLFIDNLETIRKKLPSSSVLLSRLHFFLVKDPLLDSEGQSLAEENVFRSQQIAYLGTFISKIAFCFHVSRLLISYADFCFFFVEHQADKLACQHYSLTELKEAMPVEVEGPVLSPLKEGWWVHLGLNPVSTETLEKLTVNASNENSWFPTKLETFTQFTSYQIESKCLLFTEVVKRQRNSIVNQTLLLFCLLCYTESQCQAYCLLEEAATPILEDLTHTSMLASVNWRFDSIKFDHTRFFLKQQEKVVCDRYLSKAKDIYKNILESCLNNIWRQLKIVQYSSQKKHETNPKITELQCQMLNWMVILPELNFINILIIFLSLRIYSCVIVHNQQIGADFPWTHFSLVVEYDYSENSCCKYLCKNLNVTYMTFKTTLPETIWMEKISGNRCSSFLLEVQIPYVFLTTEGLLNMPDILQLLESKYSITFVERSSSYSLRLCGSTDQYVVLTIDECTAIYLQVKKINYVQFLLCIGSLLQPSNLSFFLHNCIEFMYSLRGDTVLNLVLIYAALIELTQKSEDFEVKVVLMPGIEETALVIRQIADNILIASNTSPHDWLDKSWLSVLPSETEKCLLTFPCVSPLVAQLMLKKGSSLNKLFLASFDQLQELLPEVPKKVLKNLYLLIMERSEEADSASRVSSETLIPPLNPHRGVFYCDAPSYLQMKSCSSEVVTGRKQNFFAVPKDCEDFAHLDVTNSLHVQREPVRMHCSSDDSSKNSEKENFFAAFSDCKPQDCSQKILIDQTPWNDSSSTDPCDSFAPDGFLSDFFLSLHTRCICSLLYIKFLSTSFPDSGFAEVPEFKKQRLTYERVPGRSDGQTRLKFF
uniref:Uncharacterized protein n=1 Tax=Melopsittacus undulatus TaxID=13146 RepID=A0A8V5H644_MELUD